MIIDIACNKKNHQISATGLDIKVSQSRASLHHLWLSIDLANNGLFYAEGAN